MRLVPIRVPPPRREPRRRATLLAVLLLTALMIGCASGTPSNQTATGSPTTTHTPSGDVLRIDGELVRSVLIPDPAQDAVYVLTDTGLFVHEDGRWEPTGTQNDGRRLLVDPTDPEHMYRGNTPRCDRVPDATSYALEVSRDGGRSWTVLERGRNILPLAFDPLVTTALYGTDCRLVISTNSGETWRRLDVMQGYGVEAVVVAGERLLVLGYASSGSSRLQEVDISDPQRPVVGVALLDLPGRASLDARMDRIVVGGADSVHVSDDGGLSWVASQVGLEGVTSAADLQPRREGTVDTIESFGVHVVKIEPHNRHRIWAGTADGLFISQDDGVSWVRYTEIAAGVSVVDIQFAINDADLYVTTDEGVVVVPVP